MRTLMILLFAVLTVTLATAQIRVEGAYANYTGTATDIVDANENWNKHFDIVADYPYYYQITVSIDTAANVAGNAAGCTVYLYGSNDMVNYSTLETVVYTGDVDTVMTLTNFDTYTVTNDTTGASTKYQFPRTVTFTQKGCMWRYLTLRLDGASAATDIELQRISLKIVRRD